MSSNELSWPDVKSMLGEQIQAAEDAGDTGAVRDLEDLRRRIDEMQWTGAHARHPAGEYDEAVGGLAEVLCPIHEWTADTAAASGSRDQRAAEHHVPSGI